MNNLRQVFYKFCEKNKEVLICLDETFCFARSPETKPKNCISITSIMDKDDVYECLKEEGSAIINFKLTNKGVNKNLNINKILNSFVSSLVEFNFDPFIVTLLSTEVIVSVVISDKDIGFVNDTESDYGDDKDVVDENDIDDKDTEDNVVESDVDDVDVDHENNKENDVEDEDENFGGKVEVEDKGENDSCLVNINDTDIDDDSIDGDTEEVETSDGDDEEDDEEDDEDDPIKNEISLIKKELESENINKLKKNDFVSFLSRLNIKNINGKNTRHCNKKELHDFLIGKLEN
jgi:hypothetical protein